MTFKNWQWAVTDYGVESVHGATSPTIDGITPPYHFDATRLVEMTERPNGTFYDWPVHMAEKTWVDIDAFNEAFEKALELRQGRYSPVLDPEMLRASFVEARRISAESRRLA